MKEWKIFEEAVLNYQKQYFPGAEITYDKKILGKKSDTERQIDIWIEYKIGNIKFNIAFECKKYSRNLDVKNIEAIIGLFDDVGATKGVIFTSKGYSQAAIKRADNEGIDLFTLKHKDLKCFTDKIGKLNLITDLRMLKNLNIRAKSKILTNRINVETSDIASFQIFDSNRKLIGTPGEIFSRKWNSGHYSTEIGVYEYLEIFDNPVYIIDNAQLVQVWYQISFEVYRDLYQGYLEKEEILSVTNSIENSTIYEEFNFNTKQLMKGSLKDLISKLKKVKNLPNDMTVMMQILVPLGDNKKI